MCCQKYSDIFRHQCPDYLQNKSIQPIFVCHLHFQLSKDCLLAHPKLNYKRTHQLPVGITNLDKQMSGRVPSGVQYKGFFFLFIFGKCLIQLKLSVETRFEGMAVMQHSTFMSLAGFLKKFKHRRYIDT